MGLNFYKNSFGGAETILSYINKVALRQLCVKNILTPERAYRLCRFLPESSVYGMILLYGSVENIAMHH
jgi:hypothetical protein